MNILKKLLFSDGLKFSELNLDNKIETNLLTFHIDQLIKQGFISKEAEKYKLTVKGKEEANRMDSDSVKVLKQGKIGTIQCCVRNINTAPEFLIHTRLKQPFYGSQGWPSGKVPFGQSIFESSARELKEETNLEGTGELFAVEHIRVYEKNTDELLEDKYFYFVRYIDPKGELVPNEEGKFEWVKDSELDSFWVRPYDTVDAMRELANKILDVNRKLTYEETVHHTENF